MFHSFGGGTGSGFTALLMERLSVDYGSVLNGSFEEGNRDGFDPKFSVMATYGGIRNQNLIQKINWLGEYVVIIS